VLRNPSNYFGKQHESKVREPITNAEIREHPPPVDLDDNESAADGWRKPSALGLAADSAENAEAWDSPVTKHDSDSA